MTRQPFLIYFLSSPPRTFSRRKHAAVILCAPLCCRVGLRRPWLCHDEHPRNCRLIERKQKMTFLIFPHFMFHSLLNFNSSDRVYIPNHRSILHASMPLPHCCCVGFTCWQRKREKKMEKIIFIDKPLNKEINDATDDSPFLASTTARGLNLPSKLSCLFVLDMVDEATVST